MQKVFWLSLFWVMVLVVASHELPIPEGAAAPVLDGRDDEACWQNAAVVFGLVDSGTRAPMKEATVMKLFRHGDTLYAYVFCEQQGIGRQTKPSGSVELFFTNGSSVFQLILDHAKLVLEQELVPDEILGTHPAPPWQSGIRQVSSVQADSWALELALPLGNLKLRNGSFGMNIARNNRTARETGTWMLAEHPRFRQWAAQFRDFPRAFFTGEAGGFFRTSGGRVFAAADLENAVLPDGRAEGIKAGTLLEIDPDREFRLNLPTRGGAYRYAYTPPDKVTLTLGDDQIAWPVLHFSPFMPCQVIWQSGHAFPVEPKDEASGRVVNKFEIVFDVPDGVEVLNGSPQPTEQPGRRLFVQRLSSLRRVKSKNDILTLFSCTLPPGTREVLRYYVRWPGGRTSVHELPIASVEIRPAGQPKMAAVGFYGTRDAWLEGLQAVGVNLMCSPYHRRDEDELKDLRRLRDKGFKIAYSSTQDIPFGSGRFFSTWTEEDPSSRSLDIDGRELLNPKSRKYQLSPSYRGSRFEECLAATAAYCRKAGFDYYIFDTEDHFQGAAHLGDYTERTLQGFERWFKENLPGREYVSPRVFERTPEEYPDYHQAWIEYKCEIWADFFQEVKRSMSPDGKALFIDYGMRAVDEETCHRRLTDYHWLKVFDGGIGGSWYSSVDIATRRWQKVYGEMRGKWGMDPAKAVWISPARLLASSFATTAPPVKDEMKCKFFEAMTLGARSYIIFKQSYMDMDSVRQLADAMRVLAQCEDVVCLGKRMETLSTDAPQWERLDDFFQLRQLTTWHNQPKVLAKGLEYGNRALLTVSEYREQIPREVTVFYPFQADSKVLDLETGAVVATPRRGENSFSVKLDSDHCCRIFLIVR